MAIRLSDQIVRRLTVGVDTSYTNQPNGNYDLYVKGSTLHNGTVYVANGTTYYIDNSANARLLHLDLYSTDAVNIMAQGSPWPYIQFSTRAGGSTYVTTAQTTWAQIYGQVPAKRASDSVCYSARFFFREYSKTANTTTRLSYYEDFYLPAANDDRTASASYDILTTKKTVTTAQGGTGNTSYTASRLLYTETATKFASSNIVSDGNYIAKPTYLTVNADHQTNYRFYVNGSGYFNGNVYIGGADSRGIYYAGTKATNRMIRFLDNTADAYGNGISIGGGGIAIFGGGEAADTMITNFTNLGNYNAGTEVTIITSDGSIRFFPGQGSFDISAELTMTASCFWAGVDGNTTREAQNGVQSGAGKIYMWSAAAADGDRGLYLPAHGTGGAYSLIRSNTNNISNLNVNYMGIRNTDSTLGHGLSLYNGPVNGKPTYGLMFAGTGTFGKWGDVQSDWATYSTMSSTNQRGWIWQSAGTAEGNMSAALSVRGVFAARAVGNNRGYVAFPQNGSYFTSTATITGALKVILPRYKTNTMLSFDVNIFTYDETNSNIVTYRIGGYEYGDSGWYASVAKAASWGKGDKVNLKVRFGYDGTNTCITIGEIDTTWKYPQVSISNITYGFSSETIANWGYGWGISFVTSLPSSVSKTIENPSLIRLGTANRIAWYPDVNHVAAGTITTDGGYLGAVNYLSVNTAHQTSYRFYVAGTSYHTGQIYSDYKSGTWVNSLTNSAFNLTDKEGSFGGWISGPTKDGRIAISTYQSADNNIYLGYGERGRTTNSYAQNIYWNGKDNILYLQRVDATWLRVINNSSNNTDDAMVYFENKNSSDWAQKIVLTTYNYGLYISGTGSSLLQVGRENTDANTRPTLLVHNSEVLIYYPLRVYSVGTSRATLVLQTIADQPNDFYMGANGANKWSLSTRASNESYRIGLYSSVNSNWAWQTFHGKTDITDSPGSITLNYRLDITQRYWGTAPTYTLAPIRFNSAQHTHLTSGNYYRPWFGGTESVTSNGYGNSWTAGLFAYRSSDIVANNVGFYLGTAWDSNATTAAVWRFARGGQTYFPSNLVITVNTKRDTAPTTGTQAMGIYFQDNQQNDTWVGLIRAYHYTNNNHSICIHAYNNAGSNGYFEFIIPKDNTNCYITWTAGRIGNTILPNINTTYDIGNSASLRWRSLYLTTSIWVGSTSYVATNSAAAGTYIGNGVIEMSASTPYIDFHKGNSTADYTGRIIADQEARLHFVYGGTAVDLTYNSRTKKFNLYNQGNIYSSSDIETAGYFLTNTTGTGAGYYLFGNNVQYGRLYIDTIGTASDASGAGTAGYARLTLGNGTARGTTGSNSGANNSAGRILIYDTGTGYSYIYAHSIESTAANFTYLGERSSTKDTAAWSTFILGNNGDQATTTSHTRGNLRIYSAGTTYTDIRSQSGYSKVFYLSPYNGDMYSVHSGSNAAVGGLEQPIYVSANGRVASTTYYLKGNINNSTATYMAYYSADRTISGTSNARMVEGALQLRPGNGSYREGLRIYPTGSWATIVLGGNDLTANSGTSANSWSIHNNNGTFYINKNNSSGAGGPRAMGTSTGWTFGNTSTNSYALNSASFICDSWVRTKGDTGWYSQDHGGGWYMTDNNWIRSYNSKPVFININSHNGWGIGTHRLALGLQGTSHVSLMLRGGDVMYGFAVNNNGNWYFGKRTSKSFESTTDDAYCYYGNATQIMPSVNNAVDLGAGSQRWQNGYWQGVIYIGNTSYTAWNSATNGTYMQAAEIGLQRTTAGGGFYIIENGTVVGRWYCSVVGTADAVGQSQLNLGNSTASGTAHNSRGVICIFGANGSRTAVWAQANGNRDFYLPNYAGAMYAVHAGDNNAVGNIYTPVYVAANGRVTIAKALPLYEARGTTTTLNKAANYVGAGAMFHLIASSSTATTDNGKPPMGDANVLQMNWDNNGGYDCQLAISTAANRMEFRDQISTKKAWREVVTSTPGTAAGGGEQPVYINASGQAAATSYALKATVNNGTATRIAYYSGARAISSGSIVTDGSYLRNVGGYNNTSYAISTASFICNSWVRTVGSSGWYNESYGGGWYMTDAKWIRSYNSKPTILDIGTNNTYGIGGHRLALAMVGGAHVSWIMKGGAVIYGFCVNSNGNWYFGKRNNDQSLESSTGDAYIYHGNATNILPSTTNSVNLGNSSNAWASITSYGGISAMHGSIWAGTAGNTAAERQVGVRSGAGSMYMWSAAATNGARGIWLPAHGTGSAHSVFTVDTNNNVTFYGTLSGNASTATALTSNAGNANIPVYFTGGKPAACNEKLGAQSANGYWGMGSARNEFNVWIRTTTQGIIPYQSGGAGSGHCGLGTSSWYFSYCYTDNDYSVHQRSSGRAYMGEWIEFSAADKGLYFPNGNGGHFHPNNGTATYGTFVVRGERNGYTGIHLRNNTNGMTIMDNGSDKGLFQEGKRWIFWYNRASDVMCIGAASNSGWKINLAENTYCYGAFYSGDIRGGQVRITGSWIGFYASANAGGARKGYIQNDGSVFAFVSEVDGMQFTFNKKVVAPRLRATATTDIGAGSVANCAFIIGNEAADHMEFDTNEIICKTNASTMTTLWLNEKCSVTAAGYVKIAVWNDYAEYRASTSDEPGRVIVPNSHGVGELSYKRLQAGARIISDTYGIIIGETETAKTPVGLTGRILAYPYRDISEYKVGDVVCSAPNGTVDIMTREEIMMYPECIIGIVNEIPTYEVWHGSCDRSKNKTIKHEVNVNGRIWIDVK